MGTEAHILLSAACKRRTHTNVEITVSLGDSQQVDCRIRWCHVKRGLVAEAMSSDRTLLAEAVHISPENLRLLKHKLQHFGIRHVTGIRTDEGQIPDMDHFGHVTLI